MYISNKILNLGSQMTHSKMIDQVKKNYKIDQS